MPYTDRQLNAIYDRTSGYCHICGKKLSFVNYAKLGRRGSWEVEHSKPKAKGGTSYLSNLSAACIACNRSKGTKQTRTARRKHGRSRAPLSVTGRRTAKRDQAMVAGALGATVGSVFGPGGTIIGAALGAKLGYDRNPDDG